MKKIIFILSILFIGPLAFADNPHFLQQTFTCTGYNSSTCNFQDPNFSISTAVMPDTYTFLWASQKPGQPISYFYIGSMINITVTPSSSFVFAADTQYAGNGWYQNQYGEFCDTKATASCPYDMGSFHAHK